MQIALRELQMKDAPRIRAVMDQGKIQQFMQSWPFPYPEGAEVRLIARASERPMRAVVDERDVLIGYVQAFPSPFPDIAPWAIGYWLAPDFWGQGIGKRMVSLFLEELDESGISHLCAGAMKHNLASIKILQSVGFEYVRDFEIQSNALDEPAPAKLFVRGEPERNLRSG